MDEEAFRTYIAEFNAANFGALAWYYGRFTRIRIGRHSES